MVLNRLLYLIYGYILVFLTGGTLVFTLFVTPVLFRSLGKNEAGHVVGVLFPPYFHLLFIFSLVALLLQGARYFLNKTTGKISFAAWGVLVVMTGYLALFLGPKAMSSRAAWFARPEDASLKAAFDSLHQQSVLLNGFILAGYLALTLFLLTETHSTPAGKRTSP